MVAEADLGTEHLRWMGDVRFTVGLLQRISKKAVYPCDIAVKVAIDDKASIRDHYRKTPGKDLQEVEYLPKLAFGTVNDHLPDDWRLIRQGVLGIFYAGNVGYSHSLRPY